jgi:two-component system, OmpR family, sensor kinase
MRIPIRLRLTLAFAAGMAIVLAALGAFVYLRVGHDLMNGIDMQLRSRAQVILGAIHQDPSLVRSSQGSLIDPDEAFAQVLSAQGEIVDASRGVAGTPILDPAELRAIDGPTFVTRHVFRSDNDPARLLVVGVGRGSSRTFVVVGATTGDRNDALRRLLIELAIAGPIALLLVSGAGWLIAGAMLDKLHESLRREQRFLDEASHELRTPLGVLRMELDLALSRARSKEELEDALRGASREAERLSRLAEDLLVLSRERDGTLRVHRRDTRIDELFEQVVTGTRARARAESVGIDVRSANGLAARIDPERIRQALDDLVDNAIRHGGVGSWVRLSASGEDGWIRMTVQDDGPGFPIDVLADGHGSPSGASPSGLGLTIVRAIAHAHGGRLELSNEPDGGAAATLHVPVSPRP